jgi:hypothetical protein
MQPLFLQTVQGNFGFNWTFNLTDSQGVVVNITNATIYFALQLVSDFTVNSQNPMTIVNAVGGVAQYEVQQDDFPVPGTYNAQIIVQFGGVETYTFSDITVTVEPALPQL